MASALCRRTDEEIRQAPFTEEADARLVYAREHGFETWDDLTKPGKYVGVHVGVAGYRTIPGGVRRTGVG